MTRLGMPTSFSSAQQRNRTFGKALAALGAATIEGVSPIEYARRELRDDIDGDDVIDALRTRSAIGGVEYGTSSGTPALSSVAQGVYDEMILGQIAGGLRLLFVEPNTAGAILGVGAAFRKPGAAIRLAPAEFSGVGLHRNNVGAIIVVTSEFAELGVRDATAADTLSRLVRDALRREVDAVFCGAAAEIAGQQPAGLAYNAQAVASTGSTVAAITADLRSVVSRAVGGGVSLRSGLFISSTEAFSYFAALGILDPSRTTLCGLPIVSGAPSGTFMLLASDFLSFARDDDISITTSTTGGVEMDDAPTGDVGAPAAASHDLISLFQSDAVALRASMSLDWKVFGPSDSSGNYAVIKLTGASYA